MMKNIKNNNRSSDLIRRSTNQNGFTLVELAIALMVIGLLIGGVLKGQELIENAKITATIRQIKAYDTATMIFRNTYNAFPGDIKRPNRIPNCTEDICNISGNGNGNIGNGPQEEFYNFFPHLTKAGLIQGPEGGNTAEKTATDQSDSQQHDSADKFFPTINLDAPSVGTTRLNLHSKAVQTTTGVILWPSSHAYMLQYLTAKHAAAFDEKMDDGSPLKGSVVIEDMHACAAYDSDADTYDEHSYKLDEDSCNVYVQAGF